MKIERINDNQIRCSLDKDDIEEYKIFDESIYQNPLVIKNLMEQILIEAKLTLGFDVGSNGVNVESNYKSNELIFIFTKNKDSVPEEHNSNICVYHIKNFDTLRFLASILKETKLCQNSLYTNENNTEIYLILKIGKMPRKDFNKLCNLIDEFGVRVLENISENFYTEHYKLRIKNNALQKISTLKVSLSNDIGEE